VKAKYKVHRFDVVMRRDQAMFEQFLNSLEGEVVSVARVPFTKALKYWNGVFSLGDDVAVPV
jgi:hypothetical protein